MKRVSYFLAALTLALSGMACASKESAAPAVAKQSQAQIQQNFQKQYAGQQQRRPMPR